jgi:hypothetical protein
MHHAKQSFRCSMLAVFSAENYVGESDIRPRSTAAPERRHGGQADALFITKGAPDLPQSSIVNCASVINICKRKYLHDGDISKSSYHVTSPNSAPQGHHFRTNFLRPTQPGRINVFTSGAHPRS